MSYVVVYDDPKSGLVATSTKGCPKNDTIPPKESFQIECSPSTRVEIDDLRKSLSIKKSSKMVPMLSMANDDMIRLCMMYPETFFFDVTGGTNDMKCNVFIMCTVKF